MEEINMKRLLIGALTVLAFSAQAGELLKLKNGVINTTQTVRELSLQPSDQMTVEFILQYKNPVTESDQQALRNQGVEIFRYIPDDALLVRTSQRVMKSLLVEARIQ